MFKYGNALIQRIESKLSSGGSKSKTKYKNPITLTPKAVMFFAFAYALLEVVFAKVFFLASGVSVNGRHCKPIAGLILRFVFHNCFCEHELKIFAGYRFYQRFFHIYERQLRQAFFILDQSRPLSGLCNHLLLFPFRMTCRPHEH